METRSAAANFWRVFGAALVLHLVAGSVPFSLGGVILDWLIGAVIFCAWASKAPRGAAIGLAVFAGLSVVVTLVFAVRDETWWRLGVVLLEIAAAVAAARAIEPARAFLADTQRRESAARDWDRKHRWE